MHWLDARRKNQHPVSVSPSKVAAAPGLQLVAVMWARSQGAAELPAFPKKPETHSLHGCRSTGSSGALALQNGRQPLCSSHSALGDLGVSGREQHHGPVRVLERGYNACPRATPQSFVACTNFKTRLFLLSVSSHTWKRPQRRPLSLARVPKAEPEACVLLLNNSPLVSRNQAS